MGILNAVQTTETNLVRPVPCETQYNSIKSNLVEKVFEKFGSNKVAEFDVQQYIDREVLDGNSLNCFIIEYAVQAKVVYIIPDIYPLEPPRHLFEGKSKGKADKWRNGGGIAG